MRDIKAAEKFILDNNFQGEIIVVDDGSTDDTARIAETVKVSPQESKRIIRSENHRGKGFAVREGIISAKGEYIMFADSGLCIPFDYVLTGLEIIKSGGYDIAHGARKLKESRISVKQPIFRRLIAWIFRQIFIYFLKIPSDLTDTQCGFKIYKGEAARKLYTESVTDGFLFDIEIILRAGKQNYRIKEFPVEWTMDPDTRLSAAKNSFGVLKELLNLKHLSSKM